MGRARGGRKARWGETEKELERDSHIERSRGTGVRERDRKGTEEERESKRGVGRGCGSVVALLLSMCEALGSSLPNKQTDAGVGKDQKEFPGLTSSKGSGRALPGIQGGSAERASQLPIKEAYIHLETSEPEFFKNCFTNVISFQDVIGQTYLP